VPLIVHVIFRLDVGGLENGLVNLINRIPQDRYRQAIICLSDFTDFRQRIESANVPVLALHKKKGKDLGVYVRLWRALRRFKPDIVHTRNLGTVDMVFPALLAGVKYRIHGEHGWDMVDLHGRNKKYLRLRRICRPFISRYIAVSSHLASWLIRQVRAAPDKVVNICNGVDAKFFAPSPGPVVRLPDSPLEGPDIVVIGTVGRLVPVKDQLTLVKAFASLIDRAPEHRQRLRLALVGEGPQRGDIQEAVTGLGLDELVWIAGQRRRVDQVLKMFDIFVLPSLNEGISNTILEAMATGLPVIATDVGGNPELVDNGETGFLVPAGDAEAMARAINRYVADPELTSQHGRNGRQKIVRHYSLDVMVDRYLAVYDDVLSGTSTK